MKIFSVLLVLCAANSPVVGEFTAPRPVTQSLDVLFDLRFSKKNRGAGDLRRHRAHYDVIVIQAATKGDFLKLNPLKIYWEMITLQINSTLLALHWM